MNEEDEVRDNAPSGRKEMRERRKIVVLRALRPGAHLATRNEQQQEPRT